jgi:hypothetical protein
MTKHLAVNVTAYDVNILFSQQKSQASSKEA